MDQDFLNYRWWVLSVFTTLQRFATYILSAHYSHRNTVDSLCEFRNFSPFLDHNIDVHFTDLQSFHTTF